VSEALWFSGNYSDLSRQGGQDAGFEFEFRCGRCSQTWRSGFTPYTLGKASGWLRRATTMASGVTANLGIDVANAAEGLSEAGWSHARDAAFASAIQAAASHFHRCAKCTHQVCAQCWNAERGLCLNCAPDVASEVESARAHGLADAAASAAREAGASQAAGVNVTAPRQLVCPQCSTETHGGKFCRECGHKLGIPGACPSCSAPIPAGAKFCPECGTRA
jgi:Double zinc ribbon